MKTTLAFTVSDITAILASCDAWWVTFVLVAWETGLRKSDLLSLEWAQLDDDGIIHAVQKKSGVEFVGKLNSQTAMALRAIKRPTDKLVFHAEGRSLPCEWQALVERADALRGCRSALRNASFRRWATE